MDSRLTLLQTGEKEGKNSESHGSIAAAIFRKLGSRNDCNATGAMAAYFGTIPMSRHLFRWSWPLPAAPAGAQCSASPLGQPEEQKNHVKNFSVFLVIENKITVFKMAY
jgi:hypothetical protein